MHDFHWELKSLKYDKKPTEIPSWLLKLRQMRGETLFENGLRPSFATSTGSYDDPDEADFNSYHIMAIKDGHIAGCLRLTLLSDDLVCSSASMLGKMQFSHLLDKNFTSRKNIVEIGRWLAHKNYQHTMLSMYLGAAGIELTKILDLKPFSYTGRKTAHAIKLFGARFFEVEHGPYQIEKLNDSINFLHLDPKLVHSRVKKQMFLMENLIKELINNEPS